jgi:hypothetical protein
MNRQGHARRGFVKKAAYLTPAILTLIAAPGYVKAGSNKIGPQPGPPWGQPPGPPPGNGL